MAKKQKRDNAFYEEQLKKCAPAVYSDFVAGKYKSLRQALLAAGSRKSAQD